MTKSNWWDLKPSPVIYLEQVCLPADTFSELVVDKGTPISGHILVSGSTEIDL